MPESRLVIGLPVSLKTSGQLAMELVGHTGNWTQYNQIGLNWDIALLGSVLQSIYEGDEPKQVLRQADGLISNRRDRRRDAIRPRGGEQRLAPIRQDENKLQLSMPMRALQDLQRLSDERMMRAGDRDAIRSVPEVGVCGGVL